MGKIIALLATLCLIFSLTACSAKQSTSFPGVTETPTTSPKAPSPINSSVVSTSSMHAIVLPTVKESIHANDGATLFTKSFQQAQVILGDSALEDKIVSDLKTRNIAILSNTAHFEEQAQLDYLESTNWSEYFIEISYTPTRLDHAVLSLFGNTFSYCGGPHPTLVTDSVTYDLENGEAIYLDDILTAECSADTLYQLVLNSLSSQSSELYYDYADALGDRFTGELHSIQDWYFSRNGLCFHFSPYDIAPYSSGTIIAELPYSNLNGFLKEKYIPSGSTVSTGSMYVEFFTDSVQDRFTNITSVTLNEGGSRILLYPDAAVTDLRIESGWRYTENEQYISGATVFAANYIDVGDAIELCANLNDSDTVLRLIYHADHQEYSTFITYDPASNSITLSNS